jgi:hypothetical protein
MDFILVVDVVGGKACRGHIWNLAMSIWMGKDGRLA